MESGLYGEVRWLAAALRADRQQLANAPLSKRAYQRLKARITRNEQRIREVRRLIREQNKARFDNEDNA